MFRSIIYKQTRSITSLSSSADAMMFRIPFVLTLWSGSPSISWHCTKNKDKQVSNCVFCWPRISLQLCNKTQLDAPFIFSLFCHSTCTCVGHIWSPSPGSILCIYNNWYVLCFAVDCLLAGLRWNSINSSVTTRPTNSQLKSTTRTNCCIYKVHLLMMGYKYAWNM